MSVKDALELFEQAKQVAATKQNTLLSWVTELPADTNVINVFEKAASSFRGERFFWQDPEQGFTYVGLGVTNRYTAEEEDSFQGLKERMAELKKHLVTNKVEEGTGPLFMGGFRFDKEKAVAKEWHSFRKATFYLPLYLLSEVGGKVYLTVNTFVFPDDSTKKWAAMKEQWERIISSDVPKLQAPELTLAKELDKDYFLQSTQEVIDLINQSEKVNKVVMSRRMSLKFGKQVDNNYVLEKLLETQENSYFFIMENGNTSFFGASPERLIAINDDTLMSSCVAGSTPRGKTPEEDEKLGSVLLQDGKNVKEHHYVVDYMQEKLAPFTNDLTLATDPILLKNRDIQHLYIRIEAEKKAEAELLDILQTIHPTPALGGTPQKMAMQIIRLKEELDRGFYGAPIGWIDFDGNGDFAVAIRSGLITDANGYLYAGCGIVADSVPEEELQETAVKFQPMLRIMGGLKND